MPWDLDFAGNGPRTDHYAVPSFPAFPGIQPPPLQSKKGPELRHQAGFKIGEGMGSEAIFN